MSKRAINKTSLAIGSGALLVALIGTPLLMPGVRGWLQEWVLSIDWQAPSSLEEDPNQPSAVLPLASQSPSERRTQLEAIASEPLRSLDRNRARYLLATDLIAQYQGGPAIEALKGLEKDYPTLAPYILLKRGRAYELTNEAEKARQTWQTVLETYPDSPVAAEALYLIGRSSSEPTSWNQALSQYPNHPRSHEIARQRLAENSEQLQLMLLLARYDAEAWDVREIRERLVEKYASQLTPQDWQAIADGYWEQWQYGKAAQAYAQAPPAPRNAYRLARGLHLDEKKDKAKAAYQKLSQTFPKEPDTGLGLRRLASLSGNKEALGYLDQVIRQFPEEAPEALLEKAEILDTLGSQKSAAQARQSLLNNYAQSEAAAQYRWEMAQRLAEQGNLVEAWQWAGAIAKNNVNSPLAPRAAFWIGKWAQQLNRPEEAKTAFKYVLGRHPESYYAWRSAVLLGWDVGDFTTVRQIAPTVMKPELRAVPPAGSALFKDLYRLGQDEDAWRLFEAEIGDKEELSVAEQFTDGLLLTAKGRHLQAISRIWTLQELEEPEQQRQWQSLRQMPQYWYALFPFPFEKTILNWSQERQLNPLLVTSLIRQESRFEPAIRSSAGATGLMQVMPATGEWVAQQLDLQDYSLTDPEDNIKLGTWYFDYTHREYNNNSLFAVASYNAGPGNVSKWQRQYSFSDPDVFVENIPFPETRGYVEAVFGNYWNYLRIYNPEISQALSQSTQAAPANRG